MAILEFPDLYIPKLSNALPFNYNDDVQKQVEDIMYQHTATQDNIQKQLQDIQTGVISDEAPSRKFVETKTIDGVFLGGKTEEAEEERKRLVYDLDDGVHIEKTNKGGYMLQTTIADPSEYIPIGSPIDLDALDRGTSIYLSDNPADAIHMIPPELAVDMCSLNHHSHRLSITCEMHFDDQLNLLHKDVYESICYNRERFTYEMYRDALFYEDNPYHKEIAIFDEFRRKSRQKRNPIFSDFNDAERSIGQWNKKRNAATKFIEEAMVNTNIAIAKHQQDFFPKGIGVYRKHMPGLEGKFFVPKVLERAYYGNIREFHFGLQEPDYTHFTSPIRRYADLLLHRLLKAQLRGEPMPYSEADLRKIFRYLNQQIARVVYLERMHHFQEKIINKRKSNSSVPITLQNKLNLKKGVEEQMLLPEAIKNELIDTIQNSEDRGDWMWIFGTYIISKETEIIEALRERLLKEIKDSKATYKNFLNAVLDTRLTRGQQNKTFKKEKNADKTFNIYLRGKTMKEENKKRKTKNILLVKDAKNSKDAIEQLFDINTDISKK